MTASSSSSSASRLNPTASMPGRSVVLGGCTRYVRRAFMRACRPETTPDRIVDDLLEWPPLPVLLLFEQLNDVRIERQGGSHIRIMTRDATPGQTLSRVDRMIALE